MRKVLEEVREVNCDQAMESDSGGMLIRVCCCRLLQMTSVPMVRHRTDEMTGHPSMHEGGLI